MNGKLAQGSQPSKRALGLLATIVMAAGTLTACSSAGLRSAAEDAQRSPVVGSVTLSEAEIKPPVLVDGVTLSLVSDSGGTVPAAGDTVSMLFDGKSAAWILYTSNNGDLSFSGTYSYSGARMTLSSRPVVSPITRSFPLLSARAPSPFRSRPCRPSRGHPGGAFSPSTRSAGQWPLPSPLGRDDLRGNADKSHRSSRRIPVGGHGCSYLAGPSVRRPGGRGRQLGVPPHRVRPALAAFVSPARTRRFIHSPLGTPSRGTAAASGPSAGPVLASFNPLVSGITELPDGIDLQSYYGATVTVAFFGTAATPASTGEQLTPDGTFSDVLNINKSVPSPVSRSATLRSRRRCSSYRSKGQRKTSSSSTAGRAATATSRDRRPRVL